MPQLPNRQLRKSSRCSGTRMLRWVSVVIPTAVVLAGSFGTTGAYAAAGGNSASHTSSASAAVGHGNGGVGNGNGGGNNKHADVMAPAAAPVVATDTTAAPTTAAGTTASSAGDHSTSGTASTVGDVKKPQPLSNADRNAGGANGQCPGGPYCSTREGSPSLNGNGNGKATGKPCAGCVGKADNKNPKGQKPGGIDHNAGYECDRNHGIGRSNPAHTGCTKPETCPPGTVRQSDGTCKTDNGGGDCTSNPTAPGCTQGGGGDCSTNPTAPGCTQGGGGDCTTNPTADGCTQGGGGDCTSNPTADGCSPGGGDCTTNPSAEGCTTNPPASCPAGQHAGADGTCVLGEKETREPTVQGEKVVKTTSSLPMTGANIAAMLMTGMAGLGLGAALLVAGGRRRRSGS